MVVHLDVLAQNIGWSIYANLYDVRKHICCSINHVPNPVLFDDYCFAPPLIFLGLVLFTFFYTIVTVNCSSVICKVNNATFSENQITIKCFVACGYMGCRYKTFWE